MPEGRTRGLGRGVLPSQRSLRYSAAPTWGVLGGVVHHVCEFWSGNHAVVFGRRNDWKGSNSTVLEMTPRHQNKRREEYSLHTTLVHPPIS